MHKIQNYVLRTFAEVFIILIDCKLQKMLILDLDVMPTPAKNKTQFFSRNTKTQLLSLKRKINLNYPQVQFFSYIYGL